MPQSYSKAGLHAIKYIIIKQGREVDINVGTMYEPRSVDIIPVQSDMSAIDLYTMLYIFGNLIICTFCNFLMHA